MKVVCMKEFFHFILIRSFEGKNLSLLKKDLHPSKNYRAIVMITSFSYMMKNNT